MSSAGAAQGTAKEPELLVNIPACTFATTNPFPSDYGDIVTIIVGSPIEKHYSIHAGLLKHYSSYFRNGLKAEWNEGATKIFTLAEDDPNIFQLFYHWIYSGRLYSTLTAEGRIPISWPDLCQLFVFGDARGIPELCNKAIDVLFQKYDNEWVYPQSILHAVYKNTPGGSNLRKILIDLAVESYGFERLRSSASVYPKDWLTDVILRSRELKTWPGNIHNKQIFINSKVREICSEYHDHRDPHKV